MRAAVIVVVACAAASCGLINAFSTCDGDGEGPCRCAEDDEAVVCVSNIDGACVCTDGHADCDGASSNCAVDTGRACFTGSCRCEDDNDDGSCVCDSDDGSCINDVGSDRVLSTQDEAGCRGACGCDDTGCSCLHDGACLTNVDNLICRDDDECRRAAASRALAQSVTCNVGDDCDPTEACVTAEVGNHRCLRRAVVGCDEFGTAPLSVVDVDGVDVDVCVPDLASGYRCVDDGGSDLGTCQFSG